jgi:hypothetical protein
MSLMSLDVAIGQVVVEEVAKAFTQSNSHDGREVKEADAFGFEAVAASFAGGFEEDGGCYIDADRPPEYEEGISGAFFVF